MRTSLNKTTEFTNLSASKIIASESVGKDILTKAYTTNAAAKVAGLSKGDIYHTAGALKVVFKLVDPVFSGEIPTGNLGQAQIPPLPPSPWTTAGTTIGTGITTGQTMTGLTSGATADVNVQIVSGLIAVNVQLVNSQTFVVGETVSIPPYSCAGCPDSEWSAPLLYVLKIEDFINV
jgi:hypothetical protein